ncbi:MAG: MG2 domain-containing protein [Thermoproteota archaeon]
MLPKRILIAISFFVLVQLSMTFVFCTSYSLVVSTDRDAYVAGEFVEISGYVKDQWNRFISTFVEITVFTPENISLHIGFIHSDSKGRFFTLLELPKNASIGNYTVQATVDETPARATFKVSPNFITCLVNSSFTYPANPILIYGQVYPARRVEVKLEFSKDGMDWKTMASIYSNSSGFYGFDWSAPREAGNYSIRALINGANGSASLRVIVRKPTMISISLSSPTTTVGKSVWLSGILNSMSRNATISIQYYGPEGDYIIHKVQADEEGLFEDMFKPEKEGTWRISASWPGDALNLPSESMEIELIVGPEPPTKLFLTAVAIEDAVVLALLARHLRNKRRSKGR